MWDERTVTVISCAAFSLKKVAHQLSKDLVIAGIHPTECSDGEFAYQAFQEGVKRLGGMDAVVGLVIDQGSDVKKGASLTRSKQQNKNSL